MSEEAKKTEETEPDRKATELSEQDLEQVAGGAAVTTNKAKTADKAFQSMDGYIRG